MGGDQRAGYWHGGSSALPGGVRVVFLGYEQRRGRVMEGGR